MTSTTTTKSKNVRGPKKPLEGRFIISELNVDTGEPRGPNKTKFVHHCGYLVQDRLPISTHEWKKKINAPDISFVSDHDKTLIWKDVLVHFTLQTDGYDDIMMVMN